MGNNKPDGLLYLFEEDTGVIKKYILRLYIRLKKNIQVYHKEQ